MLDCFSFEDARITVYPCCKAARSSIMHALAESYSTPQVSPKDVINGSKWTKIGYLRIAFCRNPYDRTQSLYADKIIESRHFDRGMKKLGFYRGMPWQDFIEKVASIPDFMAEKHLKSQYLYIYKDGPPDYLFRFEALLEGWKELQRLFKERGDRDIISLPHRRKTRKEKHKPEWINDLRGLIAKRYETDFEVLGYFGFKSFCEVKI